MFNYMYKDMLLHVLRHVTTRMLHVVIYMYVVYVTMLLYVITYTTSICYVRYLAASLKLVQSSATNCN